MEKGGTAWGGQHECVVHAFKPRGEDFPPSSGAWMMNGSRSRATSDLGRGAAIARREVVDQPGRGACSNTAPRSQRRDSLSETRVCA